MSVLKLPLLVDRQQKVSSFNNFLTFNHYKKNALNSCIEVYLW
jgi:hypothetical protein